MRKYLNLGSIKFLTGARAKAEYNYTEEDLFTPAWRSLPGPNLRLTDFESIETITTGPLGLIILAKCTFKDGEVASARVWYSIFEIIYAFTTNQTSSPSFDRPLIFPKSYVVFSFFIALIGMYILFKI